MGGLFPCYAYKLANTRLANRYTANKNTASPNPGKTNLCPESISDPFYPRFWPERLKQAYQVKKPTGIFLDDMSDWMGDYWPREWTEAELQMMRDNPWHRLYTLTKQPQNLLQFSPFPENAWVGVTATKWLSFSNALGYLAAIEAKVKYLSFEPLLERIQMDMLQKVLFPQVIDWIIIGACTGSHRDIEALSARYPELWGTVLSGNKWALFPKIEWVQEIVEAADQAGIKVFLKDNLEPLLRQSYKTFGELNGKLVKAIKYPSWKWELRQEMPE